MIDALRQISLSEGVTLHLLNSSKFKTVLFGVYIQRPLCLEEVAKNALASKIIEKCSADYPDFTGMTHKLEDLYGSVLVSDVHKYGERQMIQVKMQVPCDTYVKDDTLLDESVSFLNAVINHPYVDEKGMGGLYFDSEKEGLLYELKTRSEDKKVWAISRCIESMCAHEAYAIHEIGTEELYEKFTPKELQAHYQMVLAKSPMDIVVIGHFDADAMEKRIKEKFEISLGSRETFEREKVVFPKKEVTYFEEALTLNQGRLVLGYRMNVPYESPEFPAALLATMILGSGGSSKLFTQVREKEGLCYSTFARPDKFKSILLIYAGLETEHFNRAEKLIIDLVVSIQKGDVSAEELEIAKSGLVSTFISLSDYPNSYINFYYSQYLTNGELDIQTYIDKVNAVSVEDVVKASMHFTLDQVVKIKKWEA